MNRKTAFVLVTISALNLAATGTALAVVLVGAKKMQVEVEEVRTKANETLRKFKNAIADVEI